MEPPTSGHLDGSSRKGLLSNQTGCPVSSPDCHTQEPNKKDTQSHQPPAPIARFFLQERDTLASTRQPGSNSASHEMLRIREGVSSFEETSVRGAISEQQVATQAPHVNENPEVWAVQDEAGFPAPWWSETTCHEKRDSWVQTFRGKNC